MPKRKCTGANCPMQVGCVVPETCPEPEKCRYATFPQTNADRIRNMTDEELAKLLSTGTFIREGLKDICEIIPGCEECSLAWLCSLVEESEGENESSDSLRGIANRVQGVPGKGQKQILPRYCRRNGGTVGRRR